MSGLLGSLHTAKSGMNVSQVSIQTTSHNINNLNTPGYSRQRVEQKAKSPYSNPGFNSKLGAGQLGTGVEATDIIRIKNTFFDFQYRSEAHGYGKTTTKYEYYTNMEKIVNEPSETSISASIGNFFSVWQELSKNPTDVAARDIAIQNSKYLADNISNIKKKLDTLSEQAGKKLNDDVTDLNKMFKDLEDISKQIKIVEGSGKTPNDLLDERDRIIDELSFKMDINNEDIKKVIEQVTEHPVPSSNIEFKYDKENKKITLSYTEKNADGSTNATKTVDPVNNVSGEMQGSLEMIGKIEEYTGTLKELAKGIATSVNNALNGKSLDEIKDGKGLDHVADKDNDLFVFNKDGDPIIKVNDKYADNPRIFEITVETASKMYQLKDVKFQIGADTAKYEKTTISKFYNNMIQKLGNEAQEVIRNEKNQSKILKEIDTLKLGVSGVSLDEEMVSLIQFQHSYNASAKVLSTIDSLLDVVINGIVR